MDPVKDKDAATARREWLALEGVETLLAQLRADYPEDGLLEDTHGQVVVLTGLAEARHLDALLREASVDRRS